jgi:hypothetical protein
MVGSRPSVSGNSPAPPGASYKTFMEEAGVPEALEELMGMPETSGAAYNKAE